MQKQLWSWLWSHLKVYTVRFNSREKKINREDNRRGRWWLSNGEPFFFLFIKTVRHCYTVELPAMAAYPSTLLAPTCSLSLSLSLSLSDSLSQIMCQPLSKGGTFPFYTTLSLLSPLSSLYMPRGRHVIFPFLSPP